MYKESCDVSLELGFVDSVEAGETVIGLETKVITNRSAESVSSHTTVWTAHGLKNAGTRMTPDVHVTTSSRGENTLIILFIKAQ